MVVGDVNEMALKNCEDELRINTQETSVRYPSVTGAVRRKPWLSDLEEVRSIDTQDSSDRVSRLI
jgi:hypothetical protein